MRLVTLDRGPEGRPGVLVGDDVLDFAMAAAVLPLAAWIPATLTQVIAAQDEGREIVRRLIDKVLASAALQDALRARRALTPFVRTALRAPLPAPSLLLCHGRAYRDHVREMAGPPAGQPVGFLKTSNAVIGPGAPIVLPAAAPSQVDFEGEIAVVFSRSCHGVSPEEAMAHVAGLTLLNDVSARDWVPEMAKAPDLNRMGKQFAGFAPMGPCLATLDDLGDVRDLRLTTRVNGETMQDASTADLIWSIPELIAYYAAWYPFRAGDVLATGTPAGVGYGRDPKRFLGAGDVVEVEAAGVGVLSNPVRALDDDHA